MKRCIDNVQMQTVISECMRMTYLYLTRMFIFFFQETFPSNKSALVRRMFQGYVRIEGDDYCEGVTTYGSTEELVEGTENTVLNAQNENERAKEKKKMEKKKMTKKEKRKKNEKLYVRVCGMSVWMVLCNVVNVEELVECLRLVDVAELWWNVRLWLIK